MTKQAQHQINSWQGTAILHLHSQMSPGGLLLISLLKCIYHKPKTGKIAFQLTTENFLDVGEEVWDPFNCRREGLGHLKAVRETRRGMCARQQGHGAQIHRERLTAQAGRAKLNFTQWLRKAFYVIQESALDQWPKPKKELWVGPTQMRERAKAKRES